MSGWLSGYSQTPLLERKITLSLNNERLDISLKKISEAGGFTFSYNPAILDPGNVVDYHFRNKSVREILDEIFKGTVQYKARGKYIILTSAQRTDEKTESAFLTGYVVDEATGERLRDVSIYDPVTLTSTVTDSYGYFEIKIEKPSPELLLSVNRQYYADTLVSVHPEGRLLNIPIKINKEKISLLADSVGLKIRRFWKTQVLSFQQVNRFNIDDTLYRATQVSLVPFVGTNHKMSGHVINDFSFNILGGYSLGVRKLEIGGLFNLVRGDVKGMQFAGLFNGVGGKMQGVQFAGILNANGGLIEGAQFAGALNLGLRSADGVQVAGVGNITVGANQGPQLAGVFNLSTNDNNALQLAGVYNLTGRNMNGFQGAGVFNITGKEMKGTQLASVFNIAGKEMKGTQLTSVFNFVGKEMKGAQISGVLNYATKIKGIQIGLINITDSIKGLPIGLMSLVWKGYHKIEISADEIFYSNLSFRTGVPQFYNIFTAGAKPATFKGDETFWTFGYGLGTAPKLSRKLFLNFDVTANQIVHGHTIQSMNLLNKIYLGLDFQAFKKMSLTFGATLNGYITKNSDSFQPLFTDYQPDIFYNRSLGADHNIKMWMGAKIGLRFL